MPTAKSGSGDFKPCPAGSHVARCIAVISLGTQESPQYPSSFKIMLSFEVPGERIEVNDQPAPMTISKEYTLSLNEKANLRRDLESWRGRQFTADELKGFQVEKVLTMPCMLSVIHKPTAKGKIYAKISSISGLPKGVECPPIWHQAVKYEIEDGESEVFKALPNWIKAKILASGERQGGVAPQNDPEPEPEADPFSDVPF